MIEIPTKAFPFIHLFPDYRKRKIVVKAAETVSVYGLNWEGGSKNVYTLLDLSKGESASLAHWGQIAPWDNIFEGATIPLRPGFAVVQTGWFCGKVATMRVSVHPDNLAKLISLPSNT